MSARVLMIGAGLGGLTAALALQRAGFDVEVFEQARSLGEVGAGLTLSRGAQQVFRALGLQSKLAPYTSPSSGFPFLHYRTGALLAGHLLSGNGCADDGSEDISRQCHRADLHAILAQAFSERAPDKLHLGHRLIAVEETPQGSRAIFAGNAPAEGDALIGADGVRSTVRALLWGDALPRFTGQTAYRFLVDGPTAGKFLSLGRGAVFLGSRRTFNRYTLRSGALINCVGIVATDTWTGEGWSVPAPREEILAAFSGWHPDVTGLIGQAEAAIKWGLLDRAPLPQWRRGRISLLGDAAHAMLPFLGLGAAMAIEDAMVLARAFEAENSVERALARYESARRPRTEFVHQKSKEQGVLTQAQDPDTYNAATAPASNPLILGFDPVTAPF